MTPPSTLASPTRPAQQPESPQRATLAACLRGARGALQWRLLLWWTVLLLLPTLAAALPVWRMLAENLDWSPFAARLAERLDLLAIADLRVAMRERYGDALAGGAIVSVALTLLVSPLLAAMTAASRSTTPHPLRLGALLAAGAQGYPRMLRMLVWAAVPLAVAASVGAAATHAAERIADAATLESDAERAEHLAQLLAVVLVLLVHATLDAGRALLAAEPHRRSAVLAWFGGCRLLVRRPLALLGVYMAVSAPGLLLAGALLLVRMHVPAIGAVGTVAACVLSVLAVLALGWMRSARLLALMELVRAAR